MSRFFLVPEDDPRIDVLRAAVQLDVLKTRVKVYVVTDDRTGAQHILGTAIFQQFTKDVRGRLHQVNMWCVDRCRYTTKEEAITAVLRRWLWDLDNVWKAAVKLELITYPDTAELEKQIREQYAPYSYGDGERERGYF